MLLTELPLGLPGRIFRSPMPFGEHDRKGEALREFEENGVSVIVLQAGDDECLKRAKRSLRDLYRQEGFEVISLPIPDYGVPRREELMQAVGMVIQHAQAGRNVAIHCHAGRGRTGMFAACLAREVLGLSGEEAIGWSRRLIPGAVETREQEEMVISY